MTTDIEKRIEKAWKATEVLRQTEQMLFTFGDTELPYYLIAESLVNEGDTVVRRGEVLVKKPLILAPPWRKDARFEGFSDEGETCMKLLIHRLAYIPPFKYRNESRSLSVTEECLQATAERIQKQLDTEEDDSVAVIKGDPDLWEVSVMRYCLERIVRSTPHNIQELRERGFLDGLASDPE